MDGLGGAGKAFPWVFSIQNLAFPKKWVGKFMSLEMDLAIKVLKDSDEVITKMRC